LKRFVVDSEQVRLAMQMLQVYSVMQTEKIRALLSVSEEATRSESGNEGSNESKNGHNEKNYKIEVNNKDHNKRRKRRPRT